MESKCTFDNNTIALTDIKTESCQYPNIILSKSGKKYACWQRYKNGHDDIMFSDISNGDANNVRIVSCGGNALMPSLFECDGNIFVLWSEFAGGLWKLYAKVCDKDDQPEIFISESEGIFFPRALSDGDKAYIAWTEQNNGKSRIFMCEFSAEFIGKSVLISPEDMCYRPALIKVGNKILCIYDSFEDSKYLIKLSIYNNGLVTTGGIISDKNGFACSPEVHRTSEGITAVWYTIMSKANIEYWTAKLELDNDSVMVSRQKVASIRDWFASVELVSDGTRDLFLHSRSFRTLLARTRKSGDKKWSDSVIIHANPQTKSSGMRPSAIIDGNGEVWILYQSAKGNGHRERNSEIRLFRAAYSDIESCNDGYIDTLDNPFTVPVYANKKFDMVVPIDKSKWLQKNGYHGMDILFGDIHGQSGMSDGSGHVDMYYNFAKSISKLDFTSLTDHDSFPDIITASEWEYMRFSCNFFNRDDELTTLLAYEWTSNEVRYDFGHKNVYYPGGEGGLFRSCEPEALTPDRLFGKIKKYGGIAIPHHPAAIWSSGVSAATDWDFHDSEVQRLGEIFSRHASFEKDGSNSIYTKNVNCAEGKYIQDALAGGHRLGFISGSDSHQLEHGLEGGIMAAYLPSRDRQNLFSAMRDRFVYATTGARILVSLKVNGAYMGSEINVNCGDKVAIVISVLGTNELKSVDIVKNNVEVFSVPCNGKECNYCWNDIVQEDAYYYIRITQEDEHQAWSSPIWVDTEK